MFNKIRAEIKKFVDRIGIMNICALAGIFVSFITLDLGIRYYSRVIIHFYSTKSLAPLLFSISYIGIFTFIIYIVPKKTSHILYGAIYSFFWLYTLTQFIHFKILSKFFTVSDISLVGEANDNLNFALSYFSTKFILFFVITLLMGIATFIFIKKGSGFNYIFKSKIYIIVTIILILFIRWGAIYKLGNAVPGSQWDVWLQPRNIYNIYTNSNMSLRVSGIYEFFFRDIYINVKNKLYNDNEELIKKINKYYTDQNSSFSTVAENDELTGIFKDKNLIMVMVESIDDWLITKDTMPTLFNMENTGWNFTNRFAPSFGSGSTLNTEFSALTGLHSPISGNAAYNFNKNLFPFSLPNLFKNSDYIVNSLHFNYGTFYNRANLHKALGFNNHYSLIDMGFPSTVMYDTELVENNDIYKLIVPSKDERFMSFITTYTAHGPYDKNNGLCQNIFNDNPALITNNDYELSCVNELSKITDKFFKLLISRLETDQLLDNTIIVFFADHFAYGYSKVTQIKNTTDGNMIQNIPFVIWSNSIEPKKIDTLLDSSDITPTLASLFNLEYDPKYYVGTNVFSSTHENFVYFPNYAWYDGNIYYKGEDISQFNNQDYIIDITSKINKKIEINDAILNSDYYRFLKEDTHD